MKRLLYAVYFLAEFSRAMYFVIIAWYLYGLTGDPLYTGVLVSVGFLPGLLLNVIFGVLVDRMNRKRLAGFALLASTMVLLILIIFVQQNVFEVIGIFIAQMVIQAMGSLFRPAIQAFVAEQFAKQELPRIFSRSSSYAIVGGMLGASLGGITVGFIGVQSALICNVLTFGMAAGLLIRFRSLPIVQATSTQSGWTDFKEGLHYLHHHAFLKSLFVIMFVGQLVFHSTLGFLSVYTIEHLDASATVYGWLDACMSLGGVVAGLLGTWIWRKAHHHLAVVALIVVLSGLAIVASSTWAVLAFMGVFIIGLGTTWIRVLLQAVQQVATAGQFHGRMASLRMVCNQGAVIISGPILGWIAKQSGVSYAFVALCIPVTFVCAFAWKQAKHEGFQEVVHKVS